MLTESEREWLEERDNWFSPWCSRCDGRFHCDEHKLYGKCSLTPDTDDAALFEARVAAKLANPQWAVCWNSDSCLEFGGSKDEPRWWWDCEWCRLKHARLQVEEEIDADTR